MLTVVLFFYRNHVVMPLRIRFNYLLVAYGILTTIVIPLILNTFVCQINDSSKAKDNFQKVRHLHNKNNKKEAKLACCFCRA